MSERLLPEMNINQLQPKKYHMNVLRDNCVMYSLPLLFVHYIHINYVWMQKEAGSC